MTEPTESAAPVFPGAVGELIAAVGAGTWRLNTLPLGQLSFDHLRDEDGWAPYRISGGPGTGKSTAIIELAATALRTGAVSPDNLLVIASDRRAAKRLSSQLARRALAGGAAGGATASRQPMVRTVHSYAFGLLRLAAARHGNPPPRLLTAAEQDSILREMLRGNASDGAGGWPEGLRAALPTAGFATAVRDLLNQAQQRNLDHVRLAQLGIEQDRPAWVAVAELFRHYQEAVILRTSVGAANPEASATVLDPAALIDAALTALTTSDDFLAQERERVRVLLVDDAQNLDPLGSALLRVVGTGSDLAAFAGDPAQLIGSFRGASVRAFDQLAATGSDRDLVLRRNFRMFPAVAEAARVTARQLPRPVPGLEPADARERQSSEPDDSRQPGDANQPGESREPGALGEPGDRGVVTVAVYPSPAREADAIAALLRRQHLREGVPWERMAVIVRSVGASGAPLRRALRRAGVPVLAAATEAPLATQRTVYSLLLALKAATDPAGFTVAEAGELLAGPIGGADPMTMRRCRRGVTRERPAAASDVDVPAQATSIALRAIILGDLDPFPGLTPAEATPLRRAAAAVAAARSATTLEDRLWSAWDSTALAARWARRSAEGGTSGAQADRDLDAVRELLSVAADFSDRVPGASPGRFIEHLTDLTLGSPAAAHTVGAAVELVSAHAAAGREWDVVAVASVHEGSWPNLRRPGSLLAVPELLDVLDGTDPALSAPIAERLAEERRLFLVATTRARHHLAVSACDTADSTGEFVPSRFVTALLGATPGSAGGAEQPDPGDEQGWVIDREAARVLSEQGLVATLRAAVEAGSDRAGAGGDEIDGAGADGAGLDESAERAARQLARLAAAGVPGAHPGEWYGLAEPSTVASLWEGQTTVRLSPSAVGDLISCPLRWFLKSSGGQDEDSTPQLMGNVVHALSEALAGGVPRIEVDAALTEVWGRVRHESPWHAERERERAREMTTAFERWLQRSRGVLTEVGTEVELAARFPLGPEEPELRVGGRVDRLERDLQGRPVIIDLKTGKGAVSVADAQEHAQLRTYQVIATEPGEDRSDSDWSDEPGGAELLMLAQQDKDGFPKTRPQAPLTTAERAEWVETMRAAARSTRGPSLLAATSTECDRCPVASSCPAHEQGSAVTDG